MPVAWIIDSTSAAAIGANAITATTTVIATTAIGGAIATVGVMAGTTTATTAGAIIIASIAITAGDIPIIGVTTAVVSSASGKPQAGLARQRFPQPASSSMRVACTSANQYRGDIRPHCGA